MRFLDLYGFFVCELGDVEALYRAIYDPCGFRPRGMETQNLLPVI